MITINPQRVIDFPCLKLVEKNGLTLAAICSTSHIGDPNMIERNHKGDGKPQIEENYADRQRTNKSENNRADQADKTHIHTMSTSDSKDQKIEHMNI